MVICSPTDAIKPFFEDDGSSGKPCSIEIRDCMCSAMTVRVAHHSMAMPDGFRDGVKQVWEELLNESSTGMLSHEDAASK